MDVTKMIFVSPLQIKLSVEVFISALAFGKSNAIPNFRRSFYKVQETKKVSFSHKITLGQLCWRDMKMNSTFSLKSSIALLVLGVAMMASPKQPAKSTSDSLISYQTEIAASAVGAIANAMQYEVA